MVSLVHRLLASCGTRRVRRAFVIQTCGGGNKNADTCFMDVRVVTVTRLPHPAAEDFDVEDARSCLYLALVASQGDDAPEDVQLAMQTAFNCKAAQVVAKSVSSRVGKHGGLTTVKRWQFTDAQSGNRHKLSLDLQRVDGAPGTLLPCPDRWRDMFRYCAAWLVYHTHRCSAPTAGMHL